jgi:hypothetical protein
MLDEHVIFFEAAGIEQDAQSLAGGQPALRMLGRDALFAPAQAGHFTALFEFLNRRLQAVLRRAQLPSTRHSSGQSGGLPNGAAQQRPFLSQS